MSESQPPPFRPQEPPRFNTQEPPSPGRFRGPAKTPVWVWLLAGLGVGCGGMVVVVIGFLAVMGTMMGKTIPDSKVVPGSQLSDTLHQAVAETGVLEEGEEIRYFYSEALFDVKAGYSMMTDRKVVVYNDSWPEPAIIVPFEDILSVYAEYSDTFLDDTMVYLELEDEEVWFQLSTEGGGDRRFVEALEAAVAARQAAPPPEEG